MDVRRPRAAIAAIVLCLAGLTACDPPPPAVVVTVTTTADGADTSPGDGICRAEYRPGQFACTLRAAVQEANARHVDRIVSPAWTIALTAPLVVDPVADVLTIVPSGPGRIAIDGSAVTGDLLLDVQGAVALRSLDVVDSGAHSAISVAEGGSMVLVDGRVTGSLGSGIVVGGDALIASTNVQDNGSNGIFLAASSTATILRSSVTGNASPGIYIRSTTAPTIESTTTSGNATGILITTAATLRLSTIADGISGGSSTRITTAGSIILGGPCSGPIVSQGYNAFGTGCGTVGGTDLAIGATGLDPLVDGALPYRPISDAAAVLRNRIPVGAGPCAAGVVDQLNRVRTANGSCSVGAHEAIGALGLLTVDTAADGADTSLGDGACTTAAGTCSFRAALQEAAAAPAGSNPEIVIQDGIDPTLSPAGGRIPANHVTMSGGGATVDLGGGPGLAHCSGDTVIEDLTLTGAVNTSFVGAVSAECPAPPYAVTGRVELRSSTVSGGTGTGISGAAGVDLVVVDSDISDNSWWGIGSEFDSVTVQRSTLTGNGSMAISGNDTGTDDVLVENSTITDNGGGVSGSNLEILRSSVTGNVNVGVDAWFADATIHQSLIAGNGRGIDAQEPGTVTVTDSTISGNDVGARTVWGAEVIVQRSTLADNATALSGSADSFSVSGSALAGGTGPLCSSGATSAGWNVAGDTSCALAGAGDQQGIDPLLGALADNGGPTLTHLPAAGSPAIDAIPVGTPDLCTGALADQRGIERPQGPGCDAGAVETIALPDGDFVVTSASDGPDAVVGDGTCASSGGECTLRAALQEAAALADGTTPVVAILPGVDPVLDPALNGMAVGDVTIRGGGATVDLAGGGRALDFCDGVLTVEDITFTGAASGSVIDAPCEGVFGDSISLDGVTVTGNATSAAISGAWPEPRVFLKVTDSTISDNEVGISGGFGRVVITRSTLSGHTQVAVWGTDYSGAVDVIDSTIADNAAGVSNEERDILVRRSTFTGNTVALSTQYGTMRVEQSVISDNGTAFSTYDGGPVLTDSTVSGNGKVYSSGLAGFFSATRSTFAANEGTFQGLETPFHLAGSVIVPGTGPACEPGVTVVSGGWNVVSDTSCGLSGTGDVQGVDPLLGPLAANGGPTATHLPAAGSPAIDAIPVGTADLCVAPLVDQRGVARPQGTACDRGAVEQ